MVIQGSGTDFAQLSQSLSQYYILLPISTGVGGAGSERVPPADPELIKVGNTGSTLPEHSRLEHILMVLES